MLGRIKVLDFELGHSHQDIKGLENYLVLKLLIRLYGTPIGYITMPIYGDRCPVHEITRKIIEQYRWPIIRYLINFGLKEPLKINGLCVKDLLKLQPLRNSDDKPLITVAICTRDHADIIISCLTAIKKLDYPKLDILVIDNAPKNDDTKLLVQQYFPQIRYIKEPRPGLNWARNRAIHEARGEYIAYTDDDVIVDSGWIDAISNIFVENLEVMAVTGLVVPYELETDAQVLFEMYGGFGRGFKRKWYCLDREDKTKKETYHIGSGVFGTGANMAYRLSVFNKIGTFDPALDVGTVTNGGGDLEMFFRILQEGYTLVYEPCAIVRHCHRRKYEQLKTQITNNGIGFYSHLMRSAKAYPNVRFAILRVGVWWFYWWNIRRLLISFIHPFRFPRELILAELKGSFQGFFRYKEARRTAKMIENTIKDESQIKSNKKIRVSSIKECL